MEHFTPADGEWHPDILGDDFQQRTLPLGVDVEGDVVATLVRHRPRPQQPAAGVLAALRPGGGASDAEADAAKTGSHSRRLTPEQIFAGWDVLYVHGWNDYFFQSHVAAWFTQRGARFYALDLRKYGRSLRPGQTPGLISDLSEYDRDVAGALQAMHDDAFDPAHASSPIDELATLLRLPRERESERDHHGQRGSSRRTGSLHPKGRRIGPLQKSPKRRLALFGHSTGGLILSLWADRHPGAAQALLLNSPWLELQAKALGRQVIAPVLELRSWVDPHNMLPSIDLGFYARSVSAAQEGEWTYNDQWRRPRGFPMPTAWLSAVLTGHTRVAAGLDIRIPILTMMSAHSTLATTWSDAMLHSDSVLNVRDVAERSLGLGPEITVSRIDDALHDVFLSRPSVRTAAFAAIERWACGYLR